MISDLPNISDSLWGEKNTYEIWAVEKSKFSPSNNNRDPKMLYCVYVREHWVTSGACDFLSFLPSEEPTAVLARLVLAFPF